LAHLRFQRRDPPGREDARQQAPVDGVDGRVFEDERARRHLDVRLDDLEDPAAAGDVAPGVDEALLDVVEAADRVEVELLVVVERRLVTHPLPRGIRIGVDLDVVRVVVELFHAGIPFTSATMRAGDSGRVVTSTPNGDSASATALTTAGGAPIAPPSP